MRENRRIGTEKSDQEGGEKARHEAEKIETKAKEEADRIYKEAIEEKNRLVAETKAEMATYRKKIEAEVNTAARKTISKLKQDLSRLINEKTIKKPVKESLVEEDTLAQLMLTAIDSIKKDERSNWVVLLSQKDKDRISRYFEKNKVDLLQKGVQVEGADGIEYGFQIQPEEENFTIVFNDEAFYELFTPFLSLETIQLIKSGK